MPDHAPPSRIPHVDESRCRACSTCEARRVCPVKALVRIDPDESLFVESHLCYGCLVCLPACPYGAVVA